MKIRVIRGSKIADLIGYSITLYPYILLQSGFSRLVEQQVLSHEWVHVEQVRRYGWFSFYISYVLEFLAHLVRLKDRQAAYHSISVEVAAYRDQWSVDPDFSQIEFR